MFDQLLQDLALPGSVEGRYLLLLKLIDVAETLGGKMMQEQQLTIQNMEAITRLKSMVAENFSDEMVEVTDGWLKAIDELKAKIQQNN